VSETTTGEEARAMLDRLRAKRGYLLPHHGLLALLRPELLTAYDATYTALTLTPGVMGEKDKEMVWLSILVVTEEAIATHHLRNLRAAGGTDAEIEAVVRLASFAHGARGFRFVAEAWSAHLPDFDAAGAYRASLAALMADAPLAPGLVELALAGAHAALGQRGELALHIRGAYEHGVPEATLAESLSLVMFPAGVPRFVDAAEVWRDLVARALVPASDALKVWAAAAAEQSGLAATCDGQED
jgi:alkylhydroperoxidase/carboxymuconolactone decarboxylase family protein YurZ